MRSRRCIQASQDNELSVEELLRKYSGVPDEEVDPDASIMRALSDHDTTAAASGQPSPLLLRESCFTEEMAEQPQVRHRWSEIHVTVAEARHAASRRRR